MRASRIYGGIHQQELTQSDDLKSGKCISASEREVFQVAAKRLSAGSWKSFDASERSFDPDDNQQREDEELCLDPDMEFEFSDDELFEEGTAPVIQVGKPTVEESILRSIRKAIVTELEHLVLVQRHWFSTLGVSIPNCFSAPPPEFCSARRAGLASNGGHHSSFPAHGGEETELDREITGLLHLGGDILKMKDEHLLHWILDLVSKMKSKLEVSSLVRRRYSARFSFYVVGAKQTHQLSMAHLFAAQCPHHQELCLTHPSLHQSDKVISGDAVGIGAMAVGPGRTAYKTTTTSTAQLLLPLLLLILVFRSDWCNVRGSTQARCRSRPSRSETAPFRSATMPSRSETAPSRSSPRPSRSATRWSSSTTASLRSATASSWSGTRLLRSATRRSRSRSASLRSAISPLRSEIPQCWTEPAPFRKGTLCFRRAGASLRRGTQHCWSETARFRSGMSPCPSATSPFRSGKPQLWSSTGPHRSFNASLRSGIALVLSETAPFRRATMPSRSETAPFRSWKRSPRSEIKPFCSSNRCARSFNASFRSRRHSS